MFNEYLKKIMPVPITDIKVSKDGYKYVVSTYASILNQDKGLQLRIIERMHNNKKVKFFDGWYSKNDDLTKKEAVVEFENPNRKNNNN